MVPRASRRLLSGSGSAGPQLVDVDFEILIPPTLVESVAMEVKAFTPETLTGKLASSLAEAGLSDTYYVVANTWMIDLPTEAPTDEDSPPTAGLALGFIASGCFMLLVAGACASQRGKLSTDSKVLSILGSSWPHQSAGSIFRRRRAKVAPFSIGKVEPMTIESMPQLIASEAHSKLEVGTPTTPRDAELATLEAGTSTTDLVAASPRPAATSPEKTLRPSRLPTLPSFPQAWSESPSAQEVTMRHAGDAGASPRGAFDHTADFVKRARRYPPAAVQLPPLKSTVQAWGVPSDGRKLRELGAKMEQPPFICWQERPQALPGLWQRNMGSEKAQEVSKLRKELEDVQHQLDSLACHKANVFSTATNKLYRQQHELRKQLRKLQDDMPQQAVQFQKQGVQPPRHSADSYPVLLGQLRVH